MNPVRFGVIGVGGMGGGHARNIAQVEEARLTAVADVNEQIARDVGAQTGAVPFNDWKKMIRSGTIEAVIVATPHYFHPPMAQYAARHGVHVLSEKPVAVSVSEADKMVAACKEHNVLLGVMFQQRTEPSRRKLKEMLDNGTLGEVFRVTMFAPWYRPQCYYDSGAWRGTWKGEGGGILMNQAPHTLDQLQWLGGMPRSVQAIAATRLHNIEVENTALSILDYGEGRIGWFYASTAEISEGERIEIAGEKGVLTWQGGKVRFYELEQPLAEHLRTCDQKFGKPSGTWHDVEVEDAPSGHMQVVKAFAQAVRAGDESLMVANGEDGLRALELANAMLLAGYSHREVPLPLERARFNRMLKKLQSGVPASELQGSR